MKKSQWFEYHGQMCRLLDKDDSRVNVMTDKLPLQLAGFNHLIAVPVLP